MSRQINTEVDIADAFRSTHSVISSDVAPSEYAISGVIKSRECELFGDRYCNDGQQLEHEGYRYKEQNSRNDEQLAHLITIVVCGDES